MQIAPASAPPLAKASDTPPPDAAPPKSAKPPPAADPSGGGGGSGGPEDKDTDWKKFHKWVSDGNKSNMQDSENVLWDR